MSESPQADHARISSSLSSFSTSQPGDVDALVVKVEALKDYAEDLRSVTWLAPVSSSEMNTRDRWLADELDKIADELSSALQKEKERIQELQAYRDRNVALGLALGQILGPEYDGTDLRDVARELVALKVAHVEQGKEPAFPEEYTASLLKHETDWKVAPVAQEQQERIQELETEAKILQAQIDDQYIPRMLEAEFRLDAETGKLGNTIGELRAKVRELEAKLVAQEQEPPQKEGEAQLRWDGYEEALKQIHRLIERFINSLDDDPDWRVGDAFKVACEALCREWAPWHQTEHVYCIYCQNPVLRADALNVRNIGPFCSVCKWRLTHDSRTDDAVARGPSDDSQAAPSREGISASALRATALEPPPQCPLLSDDEYPSNPFTASCGTKFDTFEEQQQHERKHKAAPPLPPILSTPQDEQKDEGKQ